jgi:hypothetical protein
MTPMAPIVNTTAASTRYQVVVVWREAAIMTR